MASSAVAAGHSAPWLPSSTADAKNLASRLYSGGEFFQRTSHFEQFTHLTAHCTVNSRPSTAIRRALAAMVAGTIGLGLISRVEPPQHPSTLTLLDLLDW